MATKSIAWNTGSGNISVEYGGNKDGTIIVTSDNNNLYESRSQQIKVKTTDGSNIERTITIQQAAKVRTNISSAIVTAPTQTYSGVAKTPVVTVTLNGDVVQSTGYDVSYSDNTNAGTATITVTGKNDYTGTATGTFTINKVTPTVVAPTAKVLTYNETAQALVNAGSTDFGTLKYSLNNSTWSTSIPTATNQGSYTVYYKVEGDSNVNSVSSSSVACSINEKQVTATVILSETSYTYDGNAKQPSVTVKDGSTIIPSSEYSVSYSNNTNAGTATVTISDNAGGNYEVIGTATFTIAKTVGSVSISGVSLTYNGNARSLATVSGNTGTMHYSTDYSSWSTSIPTGTNANSYTVYWYMDASTNYEGISASSSRYVSSSIAKADQAAPSVSGATTTYPNTASATASGGGGQGTLTWTNGNTQTTVGSKTTKAYWSGNSNYNASPYSNEVTITMNKATGSVSTAPVNNNYTYNGTARAVASAGSGTGTMYYRLGTSGSFSTTMPTMTDASSSTLYYYAAESANYTQSTTGSITVSVQKASQSAPTVSGSTTTYPNTATASASGGGGVGSIEWESVQSQTSVGSHTTRARWTGNSNYNASPWSEYVTVQMNKASGSVNISGVSSSYNGSSQSLVSVSGATGTMHYSTDYSNWSTSIPASTNAGSWTIYWYMDASTNYEGISASTSRYVSSSIAKIFVPITTEPVAKTGLVYNGTAQQLCTNGVASIAGTWNYPTSINAATTVQGTVYFIPNDTTNYNQYSKLITTSIAKASRTLSFADSYVVLDTSSNVTKAATPSAGSGDGAITYTISSTTYATINASSGKVTSKTSDGSAVVTATIAEGSNYLSASASYNLYVFATTHDFSYTGSVQSLDLLPGSYKLQCWGAQGGSNAADSSYGITAQSGGKGGYSEGVLTVSQEKTVYIFVGGKGSSSGNGGWNGGGGGYGSSSYYDNNIYGTSRFGCGGGGTDIALVTSSMSYSSRRTNRSSASLLSRMIVAGGGSGGAMGYMETTSSSTDTQYMSGLEQGSMDSDGNSQWEVDSSSRVRQTGMFSVTPGKSCINCTINTNLIDRVGMIYYYPDGTPYSDKGWKDPATQWDAPGKWYISESADAGYVRLYFRGTQNITPSQVSSGITAYCETTVESTTTETDYQAGWPGGGTNGCAYRDIEMATQTSSGTTDGSPAAGFGNGGGVNFDNWKYVTGGGGGGWYGGSVTKNDSVLWAIRCSSGGSGWVNTSASASNRPSGYTGLQLDSGSTTAGNSSFPAPSGGNETGHSGDGYARITRL